MSLPSNAIAFLNPIGFCQPVERGRLSPCSRKKSIKSSEHVIWGTFCLHLLFIAPCWLLRMVYFPPAIGIPASSLPFGKVFLLSGKMTSIFLNSSNSLVPNSGTNNTAALRRHEPQLYADATNPTFQRRSLRRTSSWSNQKCLLPKSSGDL